MLMSSTTTTTTAADYKSFGGREQGNTVYRYREFIHVFLTKHQKVMWFYDASSSLQQRADVQERCLGYLEDCTN